jgi:hypothetical protein
MWRATFPVMKIGFTNNLAVRLKELSTAAPMNLIPIGTIWSKHARALEGRFHSQFRKNRLNGEWFSINNEIIKEIRKYTVVDDRFDDLFDLSPHAPDRKDLEIFDLNKQINALQKKQFEDSLLIEDLRRQIADHEIQSENAQNVRSCLSIRQYKKMCRA